MGRMRTVAVVTVSDGVVAGTREGVLMVESEAKELSEDVMLGAVMFGHEQFQAVINAVIDLAEKAAKEPWAMPVEAPQRADLEKRLRRALMHLQTHQARKLV